MSLKSLACVSMAACGLMLSATSAPAQSWWNPLNPYGKPAYGSAGYPVGYGGYNSGMNCANGVCTPKPAYSTAYCPNGNCSATQCGPNGCGPAKCGPNGCGVNSFGYGSNFGSSYRAPSYVPTYRTPSSFYETRRVPMSRTSNYRVQPTSYGRVNPFYP
jgi:hypothetical protein